MEIKDFRSKIDLQSPAVQEGYGIATPGKRNLWEKVNYSYLDQ